jgi:hypothetical protein
MSMSESRPSGKVIVLGLATCILLCIVIRCIAAVPCFTECQGANWITDCGIEPGHVCDGHSCYRELLQSGYYIGRCCSGSDNERGCQIFSEWTLVSTRTAYGDLCYPTSVVGLESCGLAATYCNCLIPDDSIYHDDEQYGPNFCWDSNCFPG